METLRRFCFSGAIWVRGLVQYSGFNQGWLTPPNLTSAWVRMTSSVRGRQRLRRDLSGHSHTAENSTRSNKLAPTAIQVPAPLIRIELSLVLKTVKQHVERTMNCFNNGWQFYPVLPSSNQTGFPFASACDPCRQAGLPMSRPLRLNEHQIDRITH